jgi:hypothetical protein
MSSRKLWASLETLQNYFKVSSQWAKQQSVKHLQVHQAGAPVGIPTLDAYVGGIN